VDIFPTPQSKLVIAIRFVEAIIATVVIVTAPVGYLLEITKYGH